MLVDRAFWHSKSVFVTGHTGFKGGWLATWLADMGANVHGYALPPDTNPSYFALCGLEREIKSIVADIRDSSSVCNAMKAASPEIVFHLAAQPLVRRSYRDPAATFAINVSGTVNLLDAVRATPSVRAVVVVTSDKCYENGGWGRAYKESDPLGGHDPYSASKACVELICDAYRRSFFWGGESTVSLATVRAGNVIGGGDWCEDRIVPDAMRAFGRDDELVVRNPRSVRPWQHVLNPLAGYLAVGMRLYVDGDSYAGGWNFGPREDEAVPVSVLVEKLARRWGGDARWRVTESGHGPYENVYLRLDSSKARELLRWAPMIDLDTALEMTVNWYRAALYGKTAKQSQLSCAQIRYYEQLLESDRYEVR
jgi:CDP-glucose 4,6-dehydratase